MSNREVDEVMFCSRCGAENTLHQKYCRQCGRLLLTDTEFSLDQRMALELARIRNGDCQIGRLALTLRNVRNSLFASFVFLVILSVALAARGQAHIDLFLLAGSLVICGVQFKRFQRLFRDFVYSRNASPELTSGGKHSGDLYQTKLAISRSNRRQTAPLSVTEQTTMSLAQSSSRFVAPTP